MLARLTVAIFAVLLGTSLRSAILDPVGEGSHAMNDSLFPVAALLTVACVFHLPWI